MMNSFRQSDRGRLGLLLATLVAALVLATHVGTPQLRGAAVSVYGTVERVRSVLDIRSFFTGRATLLAENTSLKAQLSSYQARDAIYQVTQAENDSLRSLVHLASSPVSAARVVSSFDASPYGTFFIDAGATAVHPGYLVEAQGFVLGIISASERPSLVRSIFAPGIKTEALIHGIPVILEGRGNGNARAEAPRESKIRVGDTVTAPSLGGKPVGVVGALESNASSATIRILIRIPVDTDSLRFVSVSSS